MSKYLKVKHGERLPVIGGPLDGSTLPVDKFLYGAFGEASVPANILYEKVLYGIDYDARVFRPVGALRGGQTGEVKA